MADFIDHMYLIKLYNKKKSINAYVKITFHLTKYESIYRNEQIKWYTT